MPNLKVKVASWVFDHDTNGHDSRYTKKQRSKKKTWIQPSLRLKPPISNRRDGDAFFEVDRFA